MITLKAFGTLDLRQSDNRPLQAILTQPKRLALVIYLAVATPRGPHRRETLLALLWPELDETRARAGLNRAVHYARAALGNEVLLSHGQETVGLDPTVFWSDVAGFDDALDRGELAEGLALYRGPLLPGFFVDEAPDFDRWLESERARLQQRAVQAARALSEREQKEGRVVAAIEWARRSAALAPQDEAALRRLMLLLEQTGDRAGAIRAYEDFIDGPAADLGVEPAAETQALAGAIRARQTPVIASPLTMPSAAVAPVAGAAEPVPVVPPRSRRPATIAVLATMATIAIAVAALVLGARSIRGPRAAAAHDGATISVASFTSTGASAALSDSLRDLVTAQLDTTPSLRVLSSPRSASARYAVEGNVVVDGDREVLTAMLKDSAGGQVKQAAVEGARGETVRLARDLAWQLVQLSAAPAGAMELSQPAIQTHSSAALEADEAGERVYVAGRFDEATRAFRRAVDIDSSFGQAYLQMSMAAQWNDQWALAQWASSMAMKHLGSFTLLDQFRVRAWDAYVNANPVDAERLFRTVLANHTDDTEGWYTLGEVLFHWGPGLGWPRSDARRAFEQVDSIGIVGTAATVLGLYVHLARIAGMDGRPVAVDSLVARALKLEPAAPQALELRALRAFAGTASGDQARVVAELAKAPDKASVTQSMATLVSVCAADNERTAQIIDLMTTPGRLRETRGLGEVLREDFDVAHGRWDGAARLVHGSALPLPRVAEYRAEYATLPFIALSPDTLRRIRAELAAAPADPRATASFYYVTRDLLPMRRSFLLALLDIRLGDFAAATQYADSLERPPFDSDDDRKWHFGLARVVHAAALHAQHKPAEALATLGEPQVVPNHILPGIPSYPLAYERFLRGELLFELHRDPEAERWYDTFPDAGGYDLPYLAPSLFRRAEIAAQRGDMKSAQALRARADALWMGAAPEFRSWLTLVSQAR